MSTTTTANGSGISTPPTTPPALSKAQVLSNVQSLATQFSSCVEAFHLIHPSKDSDHAQKVALAKLGVQQGRLLIFGDAVGISSPPPTIAKHMIPSRPGATNPDPHLPVNFGVRDPKLDDAGTNEKVRAALNEIAGRPAHLSREEMMERYGLKSPKRLSTLEYPALDTNRLEAFREKYGLLQDLVRQTGARAGVQRSLSITVSRWTIRDVPKFESFVGTIKSEVDGLISLMDVKEQVDKGMKTDIRAMGWHPDLSGPIVRQDWEKLKLIREACVEDYPEYVEVTDTALKYLNEELRGTALAFKRAAYTPPATPVRKSSGDGSATSPTATKSPEKDRRSGFLSRFNFGSWGSKSSKGRDRSTPSPSSPQDPQRSMSEDISKPRDSEEDNTLEPVRSKSLSAIPDQPAPFNLDSRLETVPTNTTEADDGDAVPGGEREQNGLVHAETAKSLIDRHDMFKGVGRVDTKDVRVTAHGWRGS